MYKRIIIFFTVFAIAFSLLCFPVSASDYQSSATSLWDYLLHSLCKATEDAPFLSEIFDLCGYAFTDSVCNLSDDHFHHADSLANCEMGSDKYGSYALVTCKYCYTEFKYYSSDLKKAYGSPLGHGMGGSTGDDPVVGGFGNRVKEELGTTVVGNNCFYLPLQGLKLADPWGESRYLDPDSVLNSSYASFLWKSGRMGFVFTSSSPNFSAPVSGQYSLFYDFSLVNCALDEYYSVDVTKSFSLVKGQNLYSLIHGGNVGNFHNSCLLIFSAVDSSLNSSVRGNFYLKVVPHDYQVDNFTSSIGGASSRMSGLLSEMAGTLFGTMNDAGELVVSAAKSIFSEADNKYTNPATGTSANVTDWTYDYSDRSYHLTTEEGDTVTVTYGDENITIQEGDTTYNVYYVIDSSAGSDACPEGGDHDWQLGETVPATRVTAGSETRTCSKCGEERTTQLPALGHKWKVKQTSQTKYDDAGELIQQGFTIYECERCGEQYKQTDETGPPGAVPGGGGSGGGSSVDGDTSFWDDVVDFFKSIASSVASVPEWFSGFSDFLSSAFGYMPPEIVTLLILGTFSVVVLGIWKAVRR